MLAADSYWLLKTTHIKLGCNIPLSKLCVFFIQHLLFAHMYYILSYKRHCTFFLSKMKVEVVLIVYLAVKCVSPVRHYLQNGQSVLLYIAVLSHGYTYSEKTRAETNIRNIWISV